MEYENMRMPELKSLARDSGLRNYSKMRKLSWLLCFRIMEPQRTLGTQLPTLGLLPHLHRGTQHT